MIDLTGPGHQVDRYSSNLAPAAADLRAAPSAASADRHCLGSSRPPLPSLAQSLCVGRHRPPTSVPPSLVSASRPLSQGAAAVSCSCLPSLTTVRPLSKKQTQPGWPALTTVRVPLLIHCPACQQKPQTCCVIMSASRTPPSVTHQGVPHSHCSAGFVED